MELTLLARLWKSKSACAVLFMLLTMATPRAALALPARTLRQWGQETLAQIHKTMWLPERNLYAEKAWPDKATPDGPALMWDAGVQLAALAAAARLDRKTYAPLLRRYSDGMQAYWIEAKGIGGYDVVPNPGSLDRYYDDNAWIVLDLCDGYEATRDPVLIQRAKDAQRFVASGEDDTLGGGLYWHEQERNTKNTCVIAPAMVGALRLYQFTRDRSYLSQANRWYAWTNAHLLDTDGLYWDNVKLDGRVDRAKYAYNTALMIRANVLLHRVTGEAAYLTEAQRLARAAEARWVPPGTGAIHEGGAFAYLLCESFLYLYDDDKDTRWQRIAHRALRWLHAHVRDEKGFYADHWDVSSVSPLKEWKLMDQACAARAYWVAARYGSLDGDETPSPQSAPDRSPDPSAPK